MATHINLLNVIINQPQELASSLRIYMYFENIVPVRAGLLLTGVTKLCRMSLLVTKWSHF